MTANGNEAVTLSQLRTAIEGGTLSETTSGADGTEAVRLSQLKLAMNNMNIVKEYSIYGRSGGGSIQASAVPGSVVITGNGEVVGTTFVYEVENGEPINKPICRDEHLKDLSNAPKIVQEAFAAIPTTYAPPPSINGYAWFIMPCCDVFLQPA